MNIPERLFATALALLFLTSCAPYDVAVEETYEPFALSGDLADAPSASIKQVVVIDGQKYQLCPTFDDPGAALEWIKGAAPKGIDLLERGYPWYGPLSESNWELYQGAVRDMLGRQDCPEWYHEGSNTVYQLQGFFDIYENQKRNDEIIARARRGGFAEVELDLCDRAA